VGIPRIWKRSSIVLGSFLLLSCGGLEGTVKVYQLQPHGLVRKQENEVREFAKSVGFLCESPEDFRDTVTCTGGAVKVWYINPNHLLRKQTGQTRAFAESIGYLCVHPQHMKEILEQCEK